jgi:DNA-binding protein H-NS
VNFQPFYVWNKKFFHDLRIGVAVLKETIERETTKQEQLEKAKQEEKAVAEAQIEKVFACIS